MARVVRVEVVRGGDHEKCMLLSPPHQASRPRPHSSHPPPFLPRSHLLDAVERHHCLHLVQRVAEGEYDQTPVIAGKRVAMVVTVLQVQEEAREVEQRRHDISKQAMGGGLVGWWMVDGVWWMVRGGRWVVGGIDGRGNSGGGRGRGGDTSREGRCRRW